MNTFLKNSMTALALVFAAGLTSCEKENMLTPKNGQLKVSVPNYPTPGPINPIPHPGTRLDTYGDWQLLYDAKGRLFLLQSIVNPNIIRQYDLDAGNGTGISITDYEGFNLLRKTIISLDGNGRCVESWNNQYITLGGKPIPSAVTHYKYSYGPTGRLEQITNGDDPSQYDKLSNDANGLIAIAHYQGGTKTSLTSFFYSANGSTLSDHNHLNIAAGALSDQIDEFMPIYGKANASLAVECKYFDTASQTPTERTEYKYDLDYRGLILKREESHYMYRQFKKNTYLFGYK